jgi:hypothetical protein
MEIVPVPDFNDRFLVTSTGVVLSAPNSHHKSTIEMKQYLDSKGYFEVNLDNRWFKVHRLVGQLFLPENPQATDVGHIDQNKANNHVKNLQWIVDASQQLFAKTYMNKDMSRKVFGWSKHGGVNQGLLQEYKTPEWYCQACRVKQTDQMPAYMFEIIEREFARICSHCQYIKNNHNIDTFALLLSFVR